MGRFGLDLIFHDIPEDLTTFRDFVYLKPIDTRTHVQSATRTHVLPLHNCVQFYEPSQSIGLRTIVLYPDLQPQPTLPPSPAPTPYSPSHSPPTPPAQPSPLPESSSQTSLL
jgi:hypothetical protein